MLKWPHEVKTYSPQEVQEYVADPYWQTIRIGMKGMSTERKLDTLSAYRYNRLAYNSGEPGNPKSRNPTNVGVLERCHEVQIDNYINALKRGGLLNMQLEVIK